MNTDETITGTTVIRRALQGRNRKLNLAGFARDIGIATDRLEAFAAGEIDLAPDVKRAIVKAMWDGTELDIELDLLRSTNRDEPKPMGAGPPPFKPKPLNLTRSPGPQPVTPSKPAAPAKRAGWLSAW